MVPIFSYKNRSSAILEKIASFKDSQIKPPLKKKEKKLKVLYVLLLNIEKC